MKNNSFVSLGIILFLSFAVLMVKLTFWPSANETDVRSLMASIALGTAGVVSVATGAIRAKIA